MLHTYIHMYTHAYAQFAFYSILFSSEVLMKLCVLLFQWRNKAEE